MFPISGPPEDAPPELTQYQVEAAFWEHMGVTGAELDDWPEEKVRRYSIVIEQVAKWQQAQIEIEARRHSRG